MAIVEIYTSDYCSYCHQAKQLLNLKNIHFQEYDINSAIEVKQEMIKRSGKRSVPQIFINNQSIGGCDDLYALNDAQKLDKLLV